MPSIKKRPPIEENKIHLGPLSVGDATAVIFTTVEASSPAFFEAARKSSLRRQLPRKLPIREFAIALRGIVTQRKGSMYASIVTSIDGENVFHPKRFAFAMKRLGLVDDISAYFDSFGLSEVSDKMANAIPWFWADAAVIQLEMVKKSVAKTVSEAVAVVEDMCTPDINQLIEQQLFSRPITSGSAGLAAGVINFTPTASKQVYASYFRGIAQSRSIGLLDKNSSLDAIFESFRQHILANPASLQKLLPKVKYGNEDFSSRELQAIFRNKMVIMRIKKSFFDGYDKQAHSINLTRLYNALYINKTDIALADALKTVTKRRITKEVTSGIIASIIGLFFAFTGDTKGQNLPMMNVIKREAG